MIPLRSPEELEILQKAGRILARVMRAVCAHIRPGMTTADIDRRTEELILKEKALPAFKGYQGFPASACVSINEEIVHGIPGPRILLAGDIVSIDIGVNYQGYFSDMAVTIPVGRVDPLKKKLVKVAQAALQEGIKYAYPGNHLTDISQSIQSFVEANGFSVVRQFVGHGIGKSLHEEPEVPNFGPAHLGPVLKSGMVLAIEPMVNLGGWQLEIAENGWTAITKDGLASAHFEHTVAITEKGPKILSK